jgi:hypothetical protein
MSQFQNGDWLPAGALEIGDSSRAKGACPPFENWLISIGASFLARNDLIEVADEPVPMGIAVERIQVCASSIKKTRRVSELALRPR